MIKRKQIGEENYVNLIHEFRGLKVMLDRDLANLYGTDTKMINRARVRNEDRFPEDFAFQLTKEEQSSITTKGTNLVPLNESITYTYSPWVYTEQGVNMLATCLHTETAIKCSIKLMRAFSSMRQRLRDINSKPLSRLQLLEMALESEKAKLALESKVEQQQQQLTIQKPKVETYDRLLNSEGLLDWCKVAKIIGTGRTKLCKFLRDKKILMSKPRQNVPYQNFVDDGLFVTKTIVIPLGKKEEEKCSTQTFTTPKGLVYIEKLWYDQKKN